MKTFTVHTFVVCQAGYLMLLPSDPNGTYLKPLELTCHLDELLAQLASTVTISGPAAADGDFNMTFVGMVSPTMAIYTLSLPNTVSENDDVAMAAIMLDGTTFNFTCSQRAGK